MAPSSSLISLLIISLASVGSSFILEGSQTSYAQFRKWKAGLNSTLDFEFRTDENNGLLLYTDDGGTFDFFELKLVEGALRLRYNLGGGAEMVTVGRGLADNRWHKVRLWRNGEKTELSVDHTSNSRTSEGDLHFGNYSTNSHVYVGGVPSWYNTKLMLLALPSVLFEPRFGGEIRNLVFAGEDGVLHRQEMMGFKGVRTNAVDACEHHDPCQHGGICISTDSGAICECSNVDFKGLFCEKEKPPSEATFRGHEYLTYDLSRAGGASGSAGPIVSTSDEISLYFKTRQPSGFLFYTGDGADFLNLALKDGGVVLVLSLGSGSLEVTVRPARVRFDDNQWHKVTVNRIVKELSMTVDGVYTERGTSAGTFTVLSSSVVYVGGSPNTASLPGSRTRSNFVGCLRKVELTADTLKLNLIGLAHGGSKLMSVVGRLEFMCQAVEAADPVTFTTREAYLELPMWESTREGSLSFKLRTNEPDGLLLFNSGASSQGDFFGMELLEGHLFLHLNLGSGPIRVKATNRKIDDGLWHEVSLTRQGRSGRLVVDESAADFVTPGHSNQLDLEGSLMVGGVGLDCDPASLPPELWTGGLRRGYVGCLRDLVLNGDVIDVAGYARRQDSESIRAACHTLPPQCDSQPCMNGGLCEEGWNRFLCNCDRTSFFGPSCSQDVSTLSFDGTQMMRVTLNPTWRTQAEDITLRFRTSRPSGILLLTSTDNTADAVHLILDGSRLCLRIRIAHEEQVVWSGQGLNDNQWHTVNVRRRGSSIHLAVDDEIPSVASLSVSDVTLLTRTVHLGAAPAAHTRQGLPSVPDFVGHMQHLSVNDQLLMEQVRSGQLENFDVTAKFGKKERVIHHPVAFKSSQTFVGLTQLKAYSTTNIYFQFKTLEPSGLILYNGGKGQDFIAVELVNGHLHYIFNLGDGPMRVRDNNKNSLNDNAWHAVTIGRPNAKQHTLMVDESIATITSLGDNENLDLNGLLFLGGVRKAMYDDLPKQVESRYGYKGCLASLDLNGDSPDVTTDAIIPSPMVEVGCDGPDTKCSRNACDNGGVCVQQWNTYACDCDMTSFTGPTCSEESMAYEFGSDGGLVTFTYPMDRRPDTRADLLALGFITTSENAVLVRIDSASSNDYLEVEIVEGNVFVVYNMGTEDHPIGDLTKSVNDGNYHVVKFTRAGPNSTIQLDDSPVQTRNPTGRQLSVFNSQAQIQVGGRRRRFGAQIERPVEGVVAGLVVNGERILDLAAENNPATKVEGEVELLTAIPFDFRDKYPEALHSMQRTPAINYPSPGISDDLIYSGVGSGCARGDDDECVPTFDRGSGDDLITPVYIQPTRPPPQKSMISSSKPCDDEDCFQNSGAGQFPDPDTPATDKDTSAVTTTIISTSSARAPNQPTTTKQTTTTTLPTWSFSSRPSQPTTTKSYVPWFPPSTIRPPPQPPVPTPTDSSNEPKRKNKIHSDAAESTAMIIGIVAATLIAIVLVILIILRCKGRAEGSYKIDESKNYNFSTSRGQYVSGPRPVALNGSQSQLNGGSSDERQKMLKKSNGKDVKEWYV